MKFFDGFFAQKNKKAHKVCGDHWARERNAMGTLFVVCDGIGSGIYAHISAINCATRICEMFRLEMTIRDISETVAASMHRARKEEIPFSAFSIVLIRPDGQFTAFAYEAPHPVLVQNKTAIVLTPRFYTAGYEVIAEYSGTLNLGDSVMIFSDGVSQAGLGAGYGMGIGSEGVADFINKNYKPSDNITAFPERIVEMCRVVSGGQHEDDTTLMMVHCRQASQLALLSGPPSKKSMDEQYVAAFMAMPGKKVVCGSTTTDIVARELKAEVITLSMGNSFGQPPEYFIYGIDLVTEGAITLNQVYNILDEPIEKLMEDSVVEKLTIMLKQADVIHLMIGNAVNTAHEDLIFKQIGVHVRKSTLQQMIDKLKHLGKLVIERYY
jgi:hypothetical protein